MWGLLIRGATWLMNAAGMASFGWAVSDYINEKNTSEQLTNVQQSEGVAKLAKKKQMWRTLGIFGGVAISIIAYLITKKITNKN